MIHVSFSEHNIKQEFFIINTYCRLDACLNKILGGIPLRSRGFSPQLSDCELITIEIVCEFHEINGDSAIWRFADSYLRGLFPRLPAYKTFAKQSCNLAQIKQILWKTLFSACSKVHIIDGVPLSLCRYVRANRCERLREFASFSYCAAKDEPYFGVKGHMLINEKRQIVAFDLTAANVDERSVLENHFGTVKGLIIGDKGYLNHKWQEECQKQGINLFTPKRKNMDNQNQISFEKQAMKIRKTIETTFSLLISGFALNRITAITLPHFLNQIYRKILSYNFTIGLK